MILLTKVRRVTIRIQSHNKKYGLINILISNRAKTEKDHYGLHSSIVIH
jgi:hypothetical protein